ncbi:MAG: LuxR C-terminal-related transcriptional regulator [Anaerolineae bacterium]
MQMVVVNPHERSRTVLQLMASGLRACEIATTLNTSTRCVYRIRERLSQRFNAQINEHLVSVAIAEGFVYLA